jgi:hypothetical protein
MSTDSWAKSHLEAGALGEAESAFRKALQTAEAQQALSLALRAALAYHPSSNARNAVPRGSRSSGSATSASRTVFSQPDLVRARALLGGAVH